MLFNVSHSIFVESVAALNKLIEYWNLGRKLNISIDPCTPNAPWSPESANPRVSCDCNGNTCHITHLLVYSYVVLVVFQLLWVYDDSLMLIVLCCVLLI